MRNLSPRSTLGVMAFIISASFAMAQNKPQTEAPPPLREGSVSILDKLAAEGTGGAAPKRDLTGFWGSSVGQKINPIPPMTPWGEQVFHTHKNNSEYAVADSNDPDNTCDPLGFPRAMVFMTRGIAFATMPDRLIQMWQYDKTWREIFTDGRPLPNNVGGSEKDAPDPHYWGYSVGHWKDDYTFIVETTGVDENTWLDNAGHPHSVGIRVTETYKRLDHNDLEVTVHVDDPKTYAQPFDLSTAHFKWIPKQDFEEQICIGSQELDYLKLIADPGARKDAAK
ncbi:MAG TPA: hypothetical protein VFB23_08160 [Candidatus Acidoferrales bacterium]|nr:hypothetical protein [Candidatus Acidoferrales bacterium]